MKHMKGGIKKSLYFFRRLNSSLEQKICNNMAAIGFFLIVPIFYFPLREYLIPIFFSFYFFQFCHKVAEIPRHFKAKYL